MKDTMPPNIRMGDKAKKLTEMWAQCGARERKPYGLRAMEMMHAGMHLGDLLATGSP